MVGACHNTGRKYGPVTFDRYTDYGNYLAGLQIQPHESIRQICLQQKNYAGLAVIYQLRYCCNRDSFFFERAGQQKTGESEVIRNMGKYISDACLFSGKYHYVYSVRDFAACSFPAYEKDEILCRNRLLLLLFDRSGTVYHAKGIFAG